MATSSAWSLEISSWGKRSTGHTHTHTTAVQTIHTNTERATAKRRLIVEVVVAAPKLPPSAALLLSSLLPPGGRRRVGYAAPIDKQNTACSLEISSWGNKTRWV